ncbi:MAG: YceI family protein [Myxococcales bacterium]|nr:YceI family protein [Myxococcales bacterium]
MSEATIRVFTYKDGLLARLAHDLRLTLERFELELEDGDARGRFWPESLRVDGVMKRGGLDERGLSDGDKQKIIENMRREILLTARHPEITFTGTATRRGDAVAVRGQLELVGRAAPVELTLREAGGRLSGELELTPTRWGVKPYKALAGAIKLQDRVTVRVELPAPPDGDARARWAVGG